MHLLSRGELLAAFRVQAALVTGRSPLTAAVLRSCADALAGRGQRRLREVLLLGLSRRCFAHPWEAALLAAAAIHYQVLGVQKPCAVGRRLAALYPSAGGAYLGTAEEEQALAEALDQLCGEGPVDLCWFLVHGQVQASDPGRAIAWLLPALVLHRHCPMPLSLLELGASAGLRLVADRLAMPSCPLPIRHRVGIGAAQKDLDLPEAQRCLRAWVFSDQRGRLARVDACIEHWLSLRQRGEAPRLLSGDAIEELPRAMDGLLRASAGGQGPQRLIIYSTTCTEQLDEERYTRLRMRIRSAMGAWSAQVPGARAMWLEMRSLGRRMQLHAYRQRGAALESMLLGHLPPHPRSGGDLLRHGPGWEALLREVEEGAGTSGTLR